MDPRYRPVLWAVGVLGLFLLARRSSTAVGPVGVSAFLSPEMQTRRRALRQMTRRAEAVVEWPGISDFLIVKAWFESRYTLGARGNAGEIGLFQLLPMSAFPESEWGNTARVDPQILENPAVAVATAIDYALRLRKYAPGGRDRVTWYALARGWLRPSNVDDWDDENALSRRTRQNFRTAMERVGIPITFGPRQAYPGGDPANVRWPGAQRLVEILERGENA